MKHILLALVFLSFYPSVHAQIVVNSAPVTPSVCYNDGTLSLNVSGGTAPYQFLIISGPVLQNVTYPISPSSGSSFNSLHWGTYTVRITDNAGNTLLYNVTIPGNYQFPTLRDSLRHNCINVYPSLGLPPYTYSISTNGPNGPFSHQRSVGTFDSLCNNIYYVRVQDSCGNFYTTAAITVAQPPLDAFATCFVQGGIDHVNVFPIDSSGNAPYTFLLTNGGLTAFNTTGRFDVTAPYVCPDTIRIADFCGDTVIRYTDCRLLGALFCSNFLDSTATVTGTGGNPPYTYHLTINGAIDDTTIVNTTGVFTHLPYFDYLTDGITGYVTDACGRKSLPFSDSYMDANFQSYCPFDSTLTVIPGSGIITTSTMVVSCLNCSPPITLPPGEVVFTHLDTGTYFIKIVDACGEERTFKTHVPDTTAISAGFWYNSCNDVQVVGITGAGDTLHSNMTYILYENVGGQQDSITTNTTGIFNNLPNGSYTVRIIPDVCDETSVDFYLSHFLGYCYTPYFDTTCSLKLVVKYGLPDYDLPETYSLVSGSNVYREAPPGGYNGIYMNVPPGNYQLVSDSGCTVNQSFNFSFDLVEHHTFTCISRGDVMLRPLNPNFFTCSSPMKLLYTLDNGDTLYTMPSKFTEDTFHNVVADTFVVRAYLYDTTVVYGNTTLPNHNRICPLDSMVIIIPSHVVPFITSGNVTACGATDSADIPFTVHGGFPPYFISIPGYSNLTTSATSGVLPNIPVGSYTMIVSDSCGISSSFSVSVVDSCVDCDTIHADFLTSDTVACVGQTISFQNSFSNGNSYQWSINGTPFSTSANTSLTLTTPGTSVIECILHHFLCRDTFSQVIRVDVTPHFDLGADTSFCDNFSLTLSSGIDTTQWSTGITASFITVSSSGLYWGKITDGCGTFADSIKILQGFTPHIELGNDSFFCAGDSIILSAHADSATYQWNNGSAADTLTIMTGGDYKVTVTSAGCSAIDSIHLEMEQLVKDLLPADTILCDGESIILTPANGSNPVWQDGSHQASFTVTDSGLYIVTVSTRCGEFTDSTRVGFHLCQSNIHVPDAFTPNGDGNNDYFTVFGSSIAQYEIYIFNRWGELVYSSSDASELGDLHLGWDGTHKGQRQTTGTFVYRIHALGDDGKTYDTKGNLTLIR